MWWIALALTATQPPQAPAFSGFSVASQATATVRIANFATVAIGEAATDRHDLRVSARETWFRDDQGRAHPARLVELP